MSTAESSLMGRVAVAAKLITPEQLAEATRAQADQPDPNKTLGEVLLELGHLTPDGLKRVLSLQRSVMDRARKQQAAKGGKGDAPESPPKPVAADLEMEPADGPEPVNEPEPVAQPEPVDEPVIEPTAAQAADDASAEPEPDLIPGFESTAVAGEDDGGAQPQLSRVVEPSFEALDAPDSKPMTPSGGLELGADTDEDAARGLASETISAGAGSVGAARGEVAALSPKMEKVLRDAHAKGASDIHVHSKAPLRYRLHGRLVNQTNSALSPDESAAMALSLMTPSDRRIFEELGEVDFSYTLEGVGRFRTNVYRQLRGVDATLRRIPAQPPTLEDLSLPNDLAKFTNYHQGMVLLTGPTRCGKSSTMAALVNLINEERAEHILTIEDPIEYVHRSNRCLVNQRNVGRHTESFARALRGALREDPDVIVIGELRDRETISLALTAAETGHFVLATLHTDNAIRTVNRIIGSFPPDQQEQVRAMISESLRVVISQRLITRADEKGMAPALEVMVVNRAVGNLIRENKTVQIRSLLQTGKNQGMCLLDASLAELVQKNVITKDEALRHVEDPKVLG
jgi:twitching motility protein PilT